MHGGEFVSVCPGNIVTIDGDFALTVACQRDGIDPWNTRKIDVEQWAMSDGYLGLHYADLVKSCSNPRQN